MGQFVGVPVILQGAGPVILQGAGPVPVGAIFHLINHIVQGIGHDDEVEQPDGNYQLVDSINQLYNNEITPENFRDTINALPNISDNHKNMVVEYTSFYIDGNITRDDYTTYAREMLNEYLA